MKKAFTGESNMEDHAGGTSCINACAVGKTIITVPSPVGGINLVPSVCGFDVAWVGLCLKESVDGGFCTKHSGQKCWFCKEQAVYECDWTGQLVCGTPSCGKHPHGKTHVKGYWEQDPGNPQPIKSRREDLERRKKEMTLRHEREELSMKHEFELLYFDCGHPGMHYGTDRGGGSESWCTDCGWS